MLINIIGCDGAGKTTQMAMIEPWLKTRFDASVRTIKKRDIYDFERFPDSQRMFGCSYRELMYEILPNMKDEQRSLFLFFMLATSTCRFPPQAGEIVLLDGGWHKHFATEAALGVDLAWLERAGSFFPTPDVTVFLDVRPELIVKWRQLGNYGPHAPYECGCSYEITDEAFVAMMSRAYVHMRDLAGRNGWIRVDGTQPKEAVFEAIRSVLEPAIAQALERR